MGEWLRKLEAMAAAAAFAEEGEWRMARTTLKESQERSSTREADRVKQPRTRAREQSYRV
jgi:hypothetical protein